MKFYDSKHKEVEILETDGGYEEAYISQASYIPGKLCAILYKTPLRFLCEIFWSDSKLEVPDHELEYLSNIYFEYVSQYEFGKVS